LSMETMVGNFGQAKCGREPQMKGLITYRERNFDTPSLGNPLRGQVCYNEEKEMSPILIHNKYYVTLIACSKDLPHIDYTCVC
jgi:hypothetical protein